MKRFTYFLFSLILSGFLITGCGGGGGGTEHWEGTTLPTVTSTDPIDIATGVCVNKLVTATFSKAMDAATITAAGTFTVKETATGNNKPGVVTYNATTKKATFTRTTNYTAGLSYTATITTAAKDSEGNALAANKVWSFTVDSSICESETSDSGDPASCAGPGPVDLGGAASFGVLVGPAGGATFTITNPTSVTGHTGAASYVPAEGVSTLVGTKYTGVDAPYVTAKADMLTAITCASGRACDYNYAAATDFATVVGLAHGVHCVTGAMSVGSNLTLTDPGVYIFRSTGDLTSANTITLALGGTANVANTTVFWVPTGSASLGTNNVFIGTIMPDASAATTLGANTTLIPGRAFSNSDVTVNTNTIEIP